jgi:hypothetical protein
MVCYLPILVGHFHHIPVETWMEWSSCRPAIYLPLHRGHHRVCSQFLPNSEVQRDHEIEKSQDSARKSTVWSHNGSGVPSSQTLHP